MRAKIALVVVVQTILLSFQSFGQTSVFTHQDTLRGSITKERIWWDLTYYHLNIKVNPEDKTIKGENTIKYKVLDSHDVIQIDLQPPMKITKVLQDNNELTFKRDGNAYFIDLKKGQLEDEMNTLIVFFEGEPVVSSRPPWDGGFTWTRDSNNNHFIATACQGEGASLWWPCKDHMYDEPDSMLISVTVPNDLTKVSNGRLRAIEYNNDDTNT